MSKQVKPNLERSHEVFTPDFILLFNSHGPWPLDYERIVTPIRIGYRNLRSTGLLHRKSSNSYSGHSSRLSRHRQCLKTARHFIEKG